MNNKIRVGLVQVSESFGGQYYFPYSVGILQSYAQKYLNNPKEYEFLLPVYKRFPIEDSIMHLAGADIVCFSSYLWNFRLNLEIAKAIKQINPKVVTVFGGAQIPERANSLKNLLEKYPFIDIGCYGEGEIPFLKILENFADRTWNAVPSIGYLAGKDFFSNAPASRISNLDLIPSPYLVGIFDKLMGANPEVKWSAMWETNRGCPFSCSFCAWGARSEKKVCFFDFDRLCKEIDWFSEKKIEFIFCCDANFGMFERDVDIVQKVADNKLRFEYPRVFSVQNTKNSTKKIFGLQKILTAAGLQKGVNLALQSTNPDTLKSISRSNINNETYKNLQGMFNEMEIPTFTDIIVGLPMESYDTFTNGVSQLIENGQHNKIQFINLAVLENTEMAGPEYQKKYGLIIKECRIISHHTSIEKDNPFYETQYLVIGTDTMPKEKWVDCMAFSWMALLLHFNKLLQIPFIIINKLGHISYKTLIENFLYNIEEYPCIFDICSFFRKKARDIQNGEPQYTSSKEWLNIWWPPDEFVFIKLNCYAKLMDFYKESESLLKRLLLKKDIKFLSDLLPQSIMLNCGLIKKPFFSSDLQIVLSSNFFEIYKKALLGIDVPLCKGEFKYIIDRSSKVWNSWDEWCREVVWYGTKQGAFLYDCKLQKT